MSILFDKTEINGMELKNRLVRSATNEAMADEEGFPSDKLFKSYDRLAKGGVGLIITGFTFVRLHELFKTHRTKCRNCSVIICLIFNIYNLAAPCLFNLVTIG